MEAGWYVEWSEIEKSRMPALGAKRLAWAHPNKELKPLIEWLSD
jgi:hypothetical protein